MYVDDVILFGKNKEDLDEILKLPKKQLDLNLIGNMDKPLCIELRKRWKTAYSSTNLYRKGS